MAGSLQEGQNVAKFKAFCKRGCMELLNSLLGEDVAEPVANPLLGNVGYRLSPQTLANLDHVSFLAE